MPVTISYDLQTPYGNHGSYLRSMFERFGWERLGGSVLRYNGRQIGNRFYDDWLNDIAPSITFFRAYIVQHNLTLKFLTIDCISTSFLDFSDLQAPLGNPPETGLNLTMRPPTNEQSAVGTIRDFVDACSAAT